MTWQSAGICAAIAVPSASLLSPQTPWALQVLVWQAPSVPGQSAAVRQPRQWPAPSHCLLPSQVVLAGSAGLEGTPAVQTSSVQGLLSIGLSLSSFTATIWPLPSHRLCLQSPAPCCGTTVPAATGASPHTPCALHVRTWHAVSVPGQVAATTHWTQRPLPSQMLPPPHAVLAGAGACEGEPAVHRSSVHGLPSSGTSLSSVDTRALPLPSQSLTLQSPAVWTGVRMPAALFETPQAFWMQVRVRQSPSVPGQSAAVRQPTQRPC